jgi:hypothetical protein
MSEKIVTNVPPEDVTFVKSMLEADGYSVTEQPQSDGLVTLRAEAEWNADIQPVDPLPKPGKG